MQIAGIPKYDRLYVFGFSGYIYGSPGYKMNIIPLEVPRPPIVRAEKWSCFTVTTPLKMVKPHERNWLGFR